MNGVSENGVRNEFVIFSEIDSKRNSSRQIPTLSAERFS